MYVVRSLARSHSRTSWLRARKAVGRARRGEAYVILGSLDLVEFQDVLVLEFGLDICFALALLEDLLGLLHVFFHQLFDLPLIDHLDRDVDRLVVIGLVVPEVNLAVRSLAEDLVIQDAPVADNLLGPRHQDASVQSAAVKERDEGRNKRKNKYIILLYLFLN